MSLRRSSHHWLLRRAARPLGLGLLAGGVVLGAQGAAQALQYVFTDANGDASAGLTLDFQSPFNTRNATGSITGGFFLNADNTLTILDPIIITATPNTGFNGTVNNTFGIGGDAYYNSTTNSLIFGALSGDCVQGNSSNPCLAIRVPGGQLDNPTAGEQISLPTGGDSLGSYFDTDNAGSVFFRLTSGSGILHSPIKDNCARSPLPFQPWRSCPSPA